MWNESPSVPETPGYSNKSEAPWRRTFAKYPFGRKYCAPADESVLQLRLPFACTPRGLSLLDVMVFPIQHQPIFEDDVPAVMPYFETSNLFSVSVAKMPNSVPVAWIARSP